MFYINKIIGWTLSPLGVFFLSVLFGWMAWLWGGRHAWLRASGRLLIAFGLMQLWIFSCGFSVRFIGYPLEGEELDVLSLPTADAIVLLGGGIGLHEKCGRAELVSGADRAWTAARLYKAGKAPLMTVSGGGARGEVAFLADMGVDANKVVILESARNTQEEARFIADAVKGVKRILLVTSAWHMPRAKMLFEREGLDVIAAPTDYEMHYMVEYQYQINDFFPSVDALERNSYAVKEWVALFCYWLKG